MRSEERRQTKRALEACEVRRVDAEFIAASGYEVYLRAYDRYRNATEAIWDEAEFQRRMRLHAPFDDLIHFWGAFRDGALVAFYICDLFDRVEVSYAFGKFHPDHMKAHPAHALIHRMTEYYLTEQHFEYVNDGWRSLVHETNIQDFLIEKFGFRKAWTRLAVHYRWPLGPLVRATFPFRKALGRLKPQLSALYSLETVRRECAAAKAAPPAVVPPAGAGPAPGDGSPDGSAP
jgi:hypothetical protein